jgi:hypothetical protein
MATDARRQEQHGENVGESVVEKADWEERYNTIRRGRNTTVMIVGGRGNHTEPTWRSIEEQQLVVSSKAPNSVLLPPPPLLPIPSPAQQA